MKPEQLYQNLKEIAEKLGVTVSEQNFRNAGMSVKSGLCSIHEKQHIFIDKNIPLYKKNRVLAYCLSQLPLDDIFIVPAVREFLEKNK